MRSISDKLLAGLTVVILGALLIGCGCGNLRIGWREFSGAGRERASYASFDGVQTRTFRAEAGTRIELECEITVEEGSLAISLTAPDGEALWEERFEGSRETSVNVTAPADGRYLLRVTGEATGGGFDISWDVTD